MTCKLKYEEAVDYFRSAVSYLPELMKEDKRETTQWMHVTRKLFSNISRFYREYVQRVGSKEEIQEFSRYVKEIEDFTKKKSRKEGGEKE